MILEALPYCTLAVLIIVVCITYIYRKELIYSEEVENTTDELGDNSVVSDNSDMTVVVMS